MNLKRLITTGATKSIGRLMAGDGAARVVVLCYHRIRPTGPPGTTTPERFERQLAWLVEHCDVIGFDQAHQTAAEGGRRRPAVALTFDDGYADNYETALPLLLRYGATAAFFVAAGLIDQDPSVLARFTRRHSEDMVRPMTWSQVAALRQEGMQIGCHGYSHTNLASLDRDAVAKELTAAKQLLEDRLGVEITSMAYPYGKPKRSFTEATKQLVGIAGYRDAAAVLLRAVRPGDDRLAIPRFVVMDDTVEVLSEKILGAWDMVGAWQERAPAWAARLGA